MPQLIDERILPCNIDAERFILGSILLQGNECFAACEGALAVEDFMLRKHRQIFERMKDVDLKGQRIDRVTVAHELMKTGELESVDGLGYLVSLDDGLPHIANVDAYVNLVRETSTLRKIMQECQLIMDKCSTGDGSQGVLDNADAILAKLAQRGEATEEWQNPGEVIGAYSGGLGAFITPSRGGTGIQLPWPQINTTLCGLQPGDLMLVAGRPSHGKSVVGMQIGYAAAKAGRGVAYFSLEMSKESLVRRLISMVSAVDSHRMRLGFLNTDERSAIRAAANEIASIPLWMDFRAYTTPSIRRSLKRLKARREVSMVVIDHFHLLNGVGREETRDKWSRCADDLQRYAKEFNIPFVVLTQLNRKCEEENRAPQQSDLGETGKLEQNADIISFIYRPEMYGRNRSKAELRGVAEMIIAKQRNGPTGKVDMTFLKEIQRFDEARRSSDE